MTSNEPDSIKRLKECRSLLLVCEAIGLFHMVGKANLDFLLYHAGQVQRYERDKWLDDTNFDAIDKVIEEKGKELLPLSQDEHKTSPSKDLIKNHAGQEGEGLLGLLQAAHGIASGIEKQSYPEKSVRYLAQRAYHLWLSSAFGTPERNLLADKDRPLVLTPEGWKCLMEEIEGIVSQVSGLKNAELEEWEAWRKRMVGPEAFIRNTFLTTVAETRLPNNDVTLWDQSYVTAALFKSAVAGALLDESFSNSDKQIKRKVRWRLLTIGIGSDHYQARAVRIGDWTGSARALEEFFERVQRLIEVDLAIGSLIYRDTQVRIFTFPGEYKQQKIPAPWIESFQTWLQQQVDQLAHDFDLETPPYCSLSDPTRSLVPMVRARRKADRVLSIPAHRDWFPKTQNQDAGHVCPVCGIRRNGDPTNKTRPCDVCSRRRVHRLTDWLNGNLGADTIWLDEVSDSNNRLALLTLQLDIEPWLEGERTDSLRTQAIPDWLQANQIKLSDETKLPFVGLRDEICRKFKNFNKQDCLLNALNQGFRFYEDWSTFFADVVEDRAVQPPSWNELKDSERAAWLTHQLFCKLPSPGRVYRFWRQSEKFFDQLYRDFSLISANHPNHWRTRRLKIISKNPQELAQNHLYESVVRNQTCSFLFYEKEKALITTSNMARFLQPQETTEQLPRSLVLRDSEAPEKPPIQVSVEKAVDSNIGHLETYYPVICLELSPLRFRILVPLEAASACVDHAIKEWNLQFARVKDRLPLNIGVIAFPNKMSFQAVLEMARILEKALQPSKHPETWKVSEASTLDDQIALEMKRPDDDVESWLVPYRLPNGQRLDVFYPFFGTNDDTVRFDYDFQLPQGTIYRHVKDVAKQVAQGKGPELNIYPSRIATVFMDSTARRFEPPTIYYLSDWDKMREAWRMLSQIAPSMSQLQILQRELSRMAYEWDIQRDNEAKKTWLALARALLIETLNPSPQQLRLLMREAEFGRLLWTIDWHLSVIKQKF